MLFNLSLYPGFFLIGLGVIFSIWKQKLTPAAAITGACCGLLIYAGSGYTGLLMLTAFFTMGTLATSMGRADKQGLERKGDHIQRNPAQVLANAGMATLLAVLAFLFPIYSVLFQLMLAASIASATADTLSSELGMVYGKSFYNCITWRKESRGLDGAISLEGTMLGIAGATGIAVIYSVGFGWDISNFMMIVMAAVVGNFADSLLGALLERRKYLGNDAVNFLSTLIASIFCLVINYIITV